MSAETLVELYRFDERDGTYSGSVVLDYDGDTVKVKGLCSTLKPSQTRELIEYLFSRNISFMVYTHSGKNKIVDLTCAPHATLCRPG